MPEQLDNLSFAVFKVSFRVVSDDPVSLPLYAGETLHGALGRALGRVAYDFGSQLCNDCHARSQCRYGSLFDYLFKSPVDHPFIASGYDLLRRSYGNRELNNLRELPPPYIIIPLSGGEYGRGEDIIFGLTLIGRAIEFFPFIVCALEIVADGWLGKNRNAKIKLDEIASVDCSGRNEPIPVYDSPSSRIIGPGLIFDFDLFRQRAEDVDGLEGDEGRIGIRFITPVRYLKKGKVSSGLEFGEFFQILLRRIVFLSVHSPLTIWIDQLKLLEMAHKITTEASSFEVVDVKRKRDRLKFIIGEFYCTGELTPLLSYVMLGELLHVGKVPTKGFGRYEIIY